MCGERCFKKWCVSKLQNMFAQMHVPVMRVAPRALARPGLQAIAESEYETHRKQEGPLQGVIQAIVFADVTTATGMLAASPNLARERAVYGAARHTAEDSFFDEILHYMYEGDSALHMAAAAYQKEIAIDLIAKGADGPSKE